MDVYRVERTEDYKTNFHELVPRYMRYEVWHDEAERWHREDGPAVIARDPKTGKITFQGWYNRGEMHRDDGPAMICTDWEVSRELEWYRHGKLHREGAPAHIHEEMLPSGPVNSIERWYKDGKLHRIGGPASISISESGIIRTEVWSIEDMRHRDDGPSDIERDDETGVVTEENWVRGRHYHRTDGPAYILRDRLTGNVIVQRYFINGTKVSPAGAPLPQPG